MKFRQFICGSTERSTEERFVCASYLRKAFFLDSAGEGTLSVCGLGFYRLFLNGKELTRGLLSPGITNPDDLVYYDVYEVTSYLRQGRNCIGLLLGNGMQNAVGGGTWDLQTGDFVGSPKAAVLLEIDGVAVLEADESFRYSDSPILFDDLRYGEHYDARLEQPGWSLPCFDDSAWRFCSVAPFPKGEQRESPLPPIARLNSLKPCRITRNRNGYLYDFGCNSAGLCELKLKGERGQRITLSYGEVIKDGELDLENLYNHDTNRALAHKDVYICRGEGEETYLPSFTYHGFQYVEVEGITPAQATEDLLTYHIYSSAFEELTDFSCSMETVNRLQAMAKNAVRSNFYHIPTDCPHREKNGWTGDAAVSGEYMLLNFGCETNFKEWLFSIRKAQRKDGVLPGIVPTTGWGFAWGNGPAWDRVLGYLPYYVYKYTGDVEILRENGEALLRYLQYLSTRKQEAGFAFGLGDWCEIGADVPTTPLEITDTPICYDLCRKSALLFAVAGMAEAVSFAETLAGEIYEDFRKAYVTPAGACTVETQTAYALLIAYGMLTPLECESAAKRLVELIRENGNKLKTGILGAREIFHVLSRYGYGDLALEMITDDAYPSYGEWVKKGQTSLWERFHQTEDGEELRQVGGRPLTSLNHHMFGDISHWFMENIVGIAVNPRLEDPCHVVIKPCTLKKITHASGAYRRLGNTLSVEWEREGEILLLQATSRGGFRVEYDWGEGRILEETRCGDTVTLKVKL